MTRSPNARNQGAFLVLMALSDGPKHGYEVAKFIEAKSNGFFRMPFGTLYPVLHRLEKDGFIAGEIEETDSEREKKIYRLTPAGKKHAQAEANEFQLFARAINRLVPN
jgi:PadR family transcriptional regulator, regulatory protein PadR